VKSYSGALVCITPRRSCRLHRGLLLKTHYVRYNYDDDTTAGATGRVDAARRTVTNWHQRVRGVYNIIILLLLLSSLSAFPSGLFVFQPFFIFVLNDVTFFRSYSSEPVAMSAYEFGFCTRGGSLPRSFDTRVFQITIRRYNT